MAKRTAPATPADGIAGADKPETQPKPVRRMPSDARRRDIVEKAAQFFAEGGFEGTTRDLARQIGITQPLLYRYFPTKASLVREIYQAVYLDVWQEKWDRLLTDRSRSLRDRLDEFYREYTEVIMQPQWLRIYFFAGLKGVEINKLYIKFIEERILRRIVAEFFMEQTGAAPATIADTDLEIAWGLQGAIFYYGVRKHIYNAPVYLSREAAIANALDIFFAGYRQLVAQRPAAAG